MRHSTFNLRTICLLAALSGITVLSAQTPGKPRGQNGAMLSGGQKQKIALARALVHDKPIIIFDEATSNTDAYSEQQINGLLDTRLKDKTVIVITHKKEVLSKVDQIVVLKEGVVADLGRYDDLVGKSDELNVMLEKAE